MSSPLSSQEWKLLHQVMDRVDEQRQRTPVDLQRVREVALATYQQQGIDVDGETLDRALVAKTETEERLAQKPGLTLDLEQLEQHAKSSQEVEQRRKTIQEQKQHSLLMESPLYRLRLAWEKRKRPFLEHQPASDAELGRRLEWALVEHAKEYQFNRKWFPVSIATLISGLAIMAVATLAGMEIISSPWAGWGWAVWMGGLAMVGGGAAGTFGTRQQTLKSAMTTLILFRGKQALDREDYNSPDLARALKTTGYEVRGSLKVPEDKDQAHRLAQRRISQLAKQDQDVAEAWARWNTDGEHFRFNDLAVMEAYLKMQLANPLRSKNWMKHNLRTKRA